MIDEAIAVSWIDLPRDRLKIPGDAVCKKSCVHFRLTGGSNNARAQRNLGAEFIITCLSSSIAAFNMIATHHSVGWRGEHG
jgi:hypothetical protein